MIFINSKIFKDLEARPIDFYNFKIACVKVIAGIKKRAHVKYYPICLIYWQASFLIQAKFGNNGIIKFAIIKIQNTQG